jgi:hypothetical protein
MTEKQMYLSDYISTIPEGERGRFLFNMAIYFSKQTVEFLKVHDKDDYKDVPSGIEGCLEYLERHAKSCQITFYTENSKIVGCELKFKRAFPGLQ